GTSRNQTGSIPSKVTAFWPPSTMVRRTTTSARLRDTSTSSRPIRRSARNPKGDLIPLYSRPAHYLAHYSSSLPSALVRRIFVGNYKRPSDQLQQKSHL